jgi:hypothetical protein
MLDSLLCHGLSCDSTYMSQVEVGIPLHNVLDVGNCGMLLELYLFQILLYLFLHLCRQFNLLVVRCTEEPDYTVWGYTEATKCCIVVVHYYMEVVPGSIVVHLTLSSFLHAPYMYPKLFPSSSLLSYNLCHHDPLI